MVVDKLNQELKVGDKVICSINGNYSLQILKIKKIRHSTLVLEKPEYRFRDITIHLCDVVKVPEGVV